MSASAHHLHLEATKKPDPAGQGAEENQGLMQSRLTAPGGREVRTATWGGYTLGTEFKRPWGHTC